MKNEFQRRIMPLIPIINPAFRLKEKITKKVCCNQFDQKKVWHSGLITVRYYGMENVYKLLNLAPPDRLYMFMNG